MACEATETRSAINTNQVYIVGDESTLSVSLGAS